jgi:ATP adenylyltransferase
MAPTKRGGKRPEPAVAMPAGVRLWAPWRYTYLRRTHEGPQPCIFCFDRLTEAEHRERLVLFDNRDALVMLNRYPYISGHVMVAARRHVASPELLTREERIVVNDLIAASVKLMREAMHPTGFNLGANLGRSAGAGFADHMHWHIVPRWDGDNNFMSVLASARVLSQSLKDSFKQLRPVFKAVRPDLS